MSLYREICEKVSTGDKTKEFYRFQGAKTASRMDIGGDYIYFSGSLDHHMYFTVRRIKQLFARELQKEGIILNAKSIRDAKTYDKIKNLILYDENIGDLFSYRLICSKDVEHLLKENFVYNDCKPKNGRYIERVDRRVYGGGYGVADEWRELLNYLTYFYAKKKITRQDLLTIIQRMRTTGSTNRKDNIAPVVQSREDYIFRISPNILSDFNKYDIIDALERILEKDLAMPDSSLRTSSDKTIRKIIDNYEESREKTLVLLGKRRY